MANHLRIQEHRESETGAKKNDAFLALPRDARMRGGRTTDVGIPVI